MYNIFYDSHFKNQLKNFITSYLYTFLELFQDTGITDEEFIRVNYLKLAKNFENKIFNSIEEKLIDDTVF